MPEPEDKKVKELLDSATRADLERWFSLPSFEQLADQGITPAPPPPSDDSQFAEVRKRQEAALAQVDPALLAAIHRRAEPPLAALQPRPEVRLYVDPEIARFDEAMAARKGLIAEPREVVRPDDVEDALRESTPQALLRDLHRPEQDFYKVFEWVDAMTEDRIDAAAEVATTMATSMKLPIVPSAVQNCLAFMRELRAERQQPWILIKMPLRRVTE